MSKAIFPLSIWSLVVIGTYGISPLFANVQEAPQPAQPGIQDESKFGNGQVGGKEVPHSGGAPQAPAACLVDEVALGDLRRQREELEGKKKELGAKEAELVARETALNEEVKRLEELRDEISKIDQSRKKENEERIAKLIETLEGMSPKAAANMLSSMEEALAVSAIYKMDTLKVAKVLGKIDPSKSAKLVEIMTGVVRVKKPASKAVNGAAATTNEKEGGESENGNKRDQQHSSSGTTSEPGSTAGRG